MRIVRLPLQFASWGLASPRALAAYLELLLRLRRICCNEKIDFIHAGCCLPEGFAALLLKWSMGVPYLLYVHGEEMRVMAGSRELSWMARRVLQGATRLIANSHNTARILGEEWNVPENKISVLHPGVDTERFCPAPRSAVVRERLGWGDRPVILTVGRLQKRKGHDTMIRALPAIREQVPDVLYAIVGDGEQRSALEQLTDALELRAQVQFHGEPNDKELIDCYQQCDLFVLPNREINGDIEGFGIVLIEAQACGKPVVAGSSGGTRETIQTLDTGLVVNCDQPQPLAENVSKLLVDQWRRGEMGRAARRWVLQQFDWPELAARAATIPGLSRQDLINTSLAKRQWHQCANS